MAEAVGTTASVITLIGTAFSLIQQVRDARSRIKGAPKTLDIVSQQLKTVERSLGLVKEEAGLQTAGVEEQLRAITELSEELRVCLDRLAADQQRKPISQFIHVLSSGDKDDKELQGILDRLDRTRNELTLRISMAQVGLVGNLRDGFRIALSVLMETNKKVNQVLGINLVLADWVKDKLPQQTVDGIITVDASQAASIGLDDWQETATRAPIPNTDETLVVDNITLGQARIMTGNVGVENWRRVAGRKTNVAGNRFGDVCIMTGDLGPGEAARSFSADFWR
ncbi:hypothetical protein DL768_006754 [Monosporascus sp. mg162]|nr:hypothetical protein DL768_006754 [Monosporascus sp. mg162]